ncbi:MAG: hypothetical protein Kow0022_10210 [Phycisphaerales bacterium]
MPHRSRFERGFTLVELMVTIGVVAMLVAIVAPGLRMAIGTARGFKCQMGQRTVAFDFAIFADAQLHGDRGDDRGRPDFALETFQESQYGVDEFWNWGTAISVTMPDEQGNDPMRCPEVRLPLVLQAHTPCSGGAVGPSEAVSFAFNLRLHRAEVIDARGRPRAQAVRLRSSIMEHPDVPLLFDGDGARAAELGSNPLYAGPSLDSQIFAGDRYWFPARRHNGAGNFAFIDGHVARSSAPLDEPGWRWDFQPIR